jgi:hypothetical protein
VIVVEREYTERGNESNLVDIGQTGREERRYSLIHVRKAVRVNARGMTKKTMKKPEESTGIALEPREYLIRGKQPIFRYDNQRVIHQKRTHKIPNTR